MFKKIKSLMSLMLSVVFMLQILLSYNLNMVVSASAVISGSISDEMQDFSKMYSHTDGLGLVNYDVQRYDNDTSRITLGSATTPAAIVYNTPQKIDSFIVDTYRLDYGGTSAPATYKFYVSNDNINYSEVKAIETNIDKVVVDNVDSAEKIQMAERKHYQYTLTNVGGNNTFFKIEVSGVNNWNGEISKVKIDYSDSPPIVIATAGTISDNITDSSKMLSMSEGMQFVTYQPWRYDNDANRLTFGNADFSVSPGPAPRSIIYQTPMKIDSFFIDTYEINSGSQASYKFYVSQDNTTYTQVIPSKQNVEKVIVNGYDINGQVSDNTTSSAITEAAEMKLRLHYTYELKGISDGNKYLKIEMTSQGNSWNGEISNVKIDYSNNAATAGILSDDMQDSNKMKSFTSGLQFENWNPNRYDNDNYRVTIGTTTTPAAIVYNTPYKMDSFIVDTYRSDYGGTSAPATYKFYVSSDDINYSEVKGIETNIDKVVVDNIDPAEMIQMAERKHYQYTLANVLGSNTYLKIEISGVNNWNGEISKVQIAYSNNPPVTPLPISVPSLKEAYSGYFDIGVAVSGQDLINSPDPLKKHFSVLTTENCMKWDNLEPTEGVWNWTEPDKIVAFAQENNMKVRSHVLQYYTNMPAWVYTNADGTTATKEQVLARITNHIQTIMTRYKGKIASYDVTNECFNEDGSMTDTKMNNLFGANYIEMLFQIARSADPTALLGYNDYNETVTGRKNAIINLATNLKAKGLIDYVGMQGHENIQDIDVPLLGKTIDEIAATGVKVMITELDMSLYGSGDPSNLYPTTATPEVLELQAQYYGQLFDMLREHKNVIPQVNFWNVNDGTTWLTFWKLGFNRPDYPLLFNADNQPKPDFYRVLDFAETLPRPMPRVPVVPVILRSNTIYGTPTIDGELDSAWNKANVIKTDKFMGTPGAYANIRTMWDENYLYAFYEVTDSTLSDLTKNLTEPYKQDSVELFIDENNSKASLYDALDAQYRVNYNNLVTGGTNATPTDVKSFAKVTPTGYIVEMAVPFKGNKPVNNQIIGFDSQVNDDGGSGARDHIAKWCDPSNDSWGNASRWGELQLIGKTSVVTPIPAPTPIPVPAPTPVISETISNSNVTAVVDAIKAISNISTITIDVTSNKEVAKDIFDVIKGTNKIISFTQDGIQWSFSGKDITGDTKAIDMTVNVATLDKSTSSNKVAIENKVKNADVILVSFANNGQLPGKATVKLKLDAKWLIGKDKNNMGIYYYNETTKRVETVISGLKVDTEGNVLFDITHNSDYIISDKNIAFTPVVTRLGGINRYDTSVKVSESKWTTSDNVVLATGDDFADALCAAPFAKQINAPILLTSSGSLDASVALELSRLKVKKVYIIGGIGAISATVENAVIGMNIGVERISGKDRYETSLKIAQKITKGSQVFLCTGYDFADALSISSYAVATGSPILLTAKDVTSADILKFISDNKSKAYVIGGTGVIHDTLLSSVSGAERIFGSDRYATNVAVLSKFNTGFNFANIYFATGENYPDAICGAALAGIDGAPIILINNNISLDEKAYIKSQLPKVNEISILGGEGVLTSDNINKILN